MKIWKYRDGADRLSIDWDTQGACGFVTFGRHTRRQGIRRNVGARGFCFAFPGVFGRVWLVARRNIVVGA